jgi:hypothetical protein
MSIARRMSRTGRNPAGGQHPVTFAALSSKVILKSRSYGACDPCSEDMSPEQRSMVISAYESFLREWTESVGPESVLPFPKAVIRVAIYLEVLENPDCDLRNQLEIAYVQLESFVPDDEYNILSGFKNAVILAEQIAANGKPGSIVACARLLRQARGDNALRIQERISQRISARLEQIRAAGATGMGADVFAPTENFC